MKHKFTTTQQRRRSSRNNEFLRPNRHRRNLIWVSQSAQSWRKSFEVHKITSAWLSSRGKNNQWQIIYQLNELVLRCFGKSTSFDWEVLFYQQNAKVHICVVTLEEFTELGKICSAICLFFPTQHPVTVSCILFPNLNKWLSGKRLSYNDEITTQTNSYFGHLDKSFYMEGAKE